MGIRFRYSIADFPNGALTSEELLRKVTEDLQRGGSSLDAGANRVPQPQVSLADGVRKSASASVVQEEHLV